MESKKKSMENFVEERGEVMSIKEHKCNATKHSSCFLSRRSWTEDLRDWQRKERTQATPQPSTLSECSGKVLMYPWVGLRLCPRSPRLCVGLILWGRGFLHAQRHQPVHNHQHQLAITSNYHQQNHYNNVKMIYWIKHTSMYFLALSQAPPVFDAEIAIYNCARQEHPVRWYYKEVPCKSFSI